MTTQTASRTASEKAQAREEQKARKARQAQIDDYIGGMPRFNIGALLVPPIWGPGHGLFYTLLWYPVWLFADNCFFAAYSVGNTLSIALAIIVGVILTLATFLFAFVQRPQSAEYAIDKGKTKEQYRRTERIWVVVGIIVGAAMIAFATYYNLFVRAPLG